MCDYDDKIKFEELNIKEEIIIKEEILEEETEQFEELIGNEKNEPFFRNEQLHLDNLPGDGQVLWIEYLNQDLDSIEEADEADFIGFTFNEQEKNRERMNLFFAVLRKDDFSNIDDGGDFHGFTFTQQQNNIEKVNQFRSSLTKFKDGVQWKKSEPKLGRKEKTSPKCRFCDNCSNKGHSTAHSAKHRKSVIYKCYHCSFESRWKNSFAKHLKKHAQKKLKRKLLKQKLLIPEPHTFYEDLETKFWKESFDLPEESLLGLSLNMFKKVDCKLEECDVLLKQEVVPYIENDSEWKSKYPFVPIEKLDLFVDVDQGGSFLRKQNDFNESLSLSK